MTYAEADKLLHGRCRQSRRLCRNTYLRRRDTGIALRFHSTDILTLYPDGSVDATIGSWNTVTTRSRLSEFLPGSCCVCTGGREFGPDAAVLYKSGAGWTALALLTPSVTIHPDGRITGSPDLDEARLEYKHTVSAARRERYRERYWILKARRGGKSRKPLTVEIIQAERNISTRTAMIKVYGLERFLVAIGATELDCHGDYRLLDYSMDTWNRIRALKMVCPSTQTAYIHPVDPSCDSVAKALDWMFQTKGYLARVHMEA